MVPGARRAPVRRHPVRTPAEPAAAGPRALFGERLTVTALIGGAVVVVSVALLLSSHSRESG
jgi:hypothetical protein